MQMIELFLNYMKYERNRSQQTIDSYEKDLRFFASYLESVGGSLLWTDVDADLVRNWVAMMMDKGHRATTINRRLSALRSFYRFALSRHLVDCNPVCRVVGPKKDKPLPQFLKEKEMDSLLDGDDWDDDFSAIRDRAIVLTFYETGVRLAELLGLHDEDVDLVNWQLKVTGKRNKQRVIPFGGELAHVLQTYMRERDAYVDKKSQVLFLTTDGEALKADAVRYRIKKSLSRVTTLKKRSPHVLRHTFATAMLNHQAGIESVKKLLGHESLATTEIYTHTTFEQLKREYLDAHPRA